LAPLSVDEAEKVLRDHQRAFPSRPMALDDATGCYLREDIRADRDLPPFDRVTMDGVALSAAAWEQGLRSFPIENTQPAGAPAAKLANPRACWKVMTGAVLPSGADCVVPREYVTEEDGHALVEEDAPVKSGQFVHVQGMDAGAGDLVIRAGTRLTSPYVLIAAAVGRSTVTVAAPPSVALVSSGDELVPIAEKPEPHQVRASNAHALAAGLRELGMPAPAMAHYPDHPEVMRDGIRGLLAGNDVLILSGGISVGDFDYLPGILNELGVEKLFHRVRQRPGKPFWFGKGPEGQMVFALPGNPVSTLTCFHRYVRPWLVAGLGGTWPQPSKAVLAEAVSFKPPLTRFVQVTVSGDAQGRTVARPALQHGSGDYASLAGTDGFVELAADLDQFEPGYLAPFYPW
jgi:molybdopterin molybdotransferase